MQLSAINNQISCKGYHHDYNSDRVHGLEQRRQAKQWASEGCNAGLSTQDALELELRREYQTLQNKYFALQWGSEGCNASLNARDMERMAEIEKTLSAISPKNTAPYEIECDCEECRAMKSESNPYGVPDSTFYGDWAR